MSPSQSKAGRAFEYAVVCAIRNVIGEQNVTLLENSCSRLAAADFDSFEQNAMHSSVLSAEAAMRQLLSFEPYLDAARGGLLTLSLQMQPDQSGGFGDVRDVIVACQVREWQIGISAKHQHEALKHSRLSPKIDFGQQWFGHKCSQTYFDEIRPVFDKLSELKQASVLWASVPQKDTSIYVPILNAFRSELLRLDQLNPGTVAPRMVQYLIGMYDFYKVMKLQHQTKLQVYNFNGTLNRPFGRTQPSVRLDRLKLPTRIIEIDFKRDAAAGASKTTLELICDGGWQLSLRLHNASSKVEPSLKFDVNLIGRPNNLQTFSVATD